MNKITAEEITEFCVEHNAPMAKWDRMQLLRWIGWCCEQGFVLPITSDWKTLDGVAIARPTMNIREMNDPYSYDPEGRFVYIDLAIALKPETLKCLAIALVKRFGLREGVFWHRRDRKALHGWQAQRVLMKVLKEESV